MANKQPHYLHAWQHKHIIFLIFIIQYDNLITYMILFWIKINMTFPFTLWSRRKKLATYLFFSLQFIFYFWYTYISNIHTIRL